MPRFEPKDMIAALVVLVLFFLQLTGNDGGLDTAVALILGYYFAKRSESRVVVDPSNLNIQ
jgi:hypothetical protein